MKVALYIPGTWEEPKQRQILASFQDFQPEVSERAAIGAGATGLQPELDLLIEIAKLLATGFVAAIGKDAWERLKSALRKTNTIKPDSFGQGTPAEVTQHLPLRGELIWYLKFEDATVLVTLPLSFEEMERALELLPDYIDSVTSSDSKFHRLWWDHGKWVS